MTCMSEKVLFQYKTTPSFGFFGKYGGKSISVYSDGNVVESKYVFGRDEAVEERIISCVPELADVIDCLIISYEEELRRIPDKLSNGTLDGSHDCFQFRDKIISSWTIQKCDIEEVKEQNPSYYYQYKENMLYENMVIEIYNEIARTIKDYINDVDIRIF